MNEEEAYSKLAEWERMSAQLKELRPLEMELRQILFKYFFPRPEEGTNSHNLHMNHVLKGVYSYNREVDIAALHALRDAFLEKGLPVSELIQWKPFLKISEYRKLTAEEMKSFDQCLIIKPSAPSMKIVLPKRFQK